jgi:hypothetical protein
MANATPAAAVASGFPTVSMPRIPFPKLRFPKFGKRDAGLQPMDIVALRLTNMVGDQESLYADQGSYGTHPARRPSADTTNRAALEQVQVQVLYAGKKGWAAMASHPDAPGKNCVVFVGQRTSLPMIPRTRADAVDAAVEGQPACDR